MGKKKPQSCLNGKSSFVPQWCKQQWAETLETIKPRSCGHLALLIKKQLGEIHWASYFPYLFSHHCGTKLTSQRFYTTLMYLKLPIHTLSLSPIHCLSQQGLQPITLICNWHNCRACGWGATHAPLVNIWFFSKGRKGFIACLLLLWSCAVQSFLWVLWYANMQACICTNLCSCSWCCLSCS